MTFILDLIDAVTEELVPSALPILAQQARVPLGKTAGTLTVEDVNRLAAAVHTAVSRSLGPAVADKVKSTMLALKE
ncbi:MAG: hypothetical protein ABFC38_05385 [Methanospirillum sp.]